MLSNEFKSRFFTKQILATACAGETRVTFSNLQSEFWWKIKYGFWKSFLYSEKTATEKIQVICYFSARFSAEFCI